MSRFHVVSAGVAALALAAPANAQSLSDAINAALANDCSLLVGSTQKFTDFYQVDLTGVTPEPVDFFNGETSIRTNGFASSPLEVTDGLGRVFVVQPSSFPNLDPATVDDLTEDELLALFEASGVQFISLSRFESGAFAPGLAGVCQSVLVRTNSNGNSAAAGGIGGGSSSASGRSVSSLASARDQSSDNKKRKRKRKKSGREGSYDDGYLRLASADGGVGLVADAAGVGPFGVETFVDFRGGYTDIRRDTTALEGGFDGRSLWGQAALTAEFAENLAIAGAVSYQRLRGDFETTNSTGAANQFTERNLTGSLFVIGALPLATLANGDAVTLDLAAGGFYGGGEGSIERTFATTRQSSYQIDVFDPLDPTNFGGTVTLDRLTPISDDLDGEYDTRNYGFSAAASVSFDLGAFVVTPGVEWTHFTVRQSDYQESVTDAFSNGLALSFSEFRDRWSETRIGGAIARSFAVGASGVRLEGYGDLVLTGGAATPQRSATFVDDLRASPYGLSYQVDDLDKSYGVFGLVAAAGLSEGVDVFVGGETTAGHDYLRVRTVYAGVRFTP